MGVQGLRRRIEDRCPQACETVDPAGASGQFDHVYVDLNALLHRLAGAGSAEGTLSALVAELDAILLRLCRPLRSCAVLADGPAPLAKLRLQRARRRQRALNTPPGEWGTLHLTPGSAFMAKVTAVARWWCLERGARELEGVALTVSGADAPGEGEAKAFELIRRQCAGGCTAESFCLVGNDSDLVLGAVAAVGALNVTCVDPSSGAVVCAADLVATWLTDGPYETEGRGRRFVAAAQLPGARLDFALLALVAGNDYLPPLSGVDSCAVWSAYADLRRDAPKSSSIVSAQADGRLRADPALLADVLSKAASPRHSSCAAAGDSAAAARYVKGLMWCVETLAGGGCTDYGFSCDIGDIGVQAVVQWLETAAGARQHARKRRRGQQQPGGVAAPRSDRAPPGPLAYLLCALPTAARWLLPAACAEQLAAAGRRGGSAACLLTDEVADAGELAAAAEAVVAAAAQQQGEGALSPPQRRRVRLGGATCCRAASTACCAVCGSSPQAAAGLPPPKPQPGVEGLNFGSSRGGGRKRRRGATASGCAALPAEHSCRLPAGLPPVPLVQRGVTVAVRPFSGSAAGWELRGAEGGGAPPGKRRRRMAPAAGAGQTMQAALCMDMEV
eukprot:TRINITY_DN56015_c0_g1_i1.p1 TRINITY_DN56015_c0_g1~~TRINITY_DN56015_c0_g1_i1.p1  ORF type:complete len:646 (+),score=182.71 TRINITY_DN56015_c0_g1_i1:88-1938(+)